MMCIFQVFLQLFSDVAKGDPFFVRVFSSIEGSLLLPDKVLVLSSYPWWLITSRDLSEDKFLDYVSYAMLGVEPIGIDQILL